MEKTWQERFDFCYPEAEERGIVDIEGLKIFISHTIQQERAKAYNEGYEDGQSLGASIGGTVGI